MMAAADATTDPAGRLPSCSTTTTATRSCWPRRLATVDVLSGGRVELGLGAGWMNTDYEQSGIPMDEPRRADQPHGGGHRRPQGAASPPAPSPTRASTTRSPAYDSKPKPVQSAAAAAHRRWGQAACCRSPGARPRSWASTPRSTAGGRCRRPPRTGPRSRPTRRWRG